MIKSITYKILAIFLLCFANMGIHATEYKVEVRGQKAGMAELDFALEKSGNYNITLQLKPNMIAKMLGIGDMQEFAKGKLINGIMQPTLYQRLDSSGKLLLSAKFNPNFALVNEKGIETKIPKQPLMQDPLSQIMQISADLKHNKLKDSYLLLTNKRVRRYTANHEDNKIILTQANSGKRIITLWFDRDNQLLRMQKIKKNKVDFDMKRSTS